MKIVIDDEKIIDLLEIEWGYEGIREDITRVIRENGIPLEDIMSEIKALREHPDLPNGEYRGVWACTDIINKYIGGKE